MGYLTEALLRGLIQESQDWCQYALGEDRGPFLGQALISILRFVVAVVCLPVRVSQSSCSAVFLTGWLSGFHSCFGPSSVNAQRGLGHSPLAVEQYITVCGLNSHDSGCSGQCLFLHQADGKYLVSLVCLKPAKQDSQCWEEDSLICL